MAKNNSEGFGPITDKKGNQYFFGAGRFAGQMIKNPKAPLKAPKKKKFNANKFQAIKRSVFGLKKGK